MVTETDDSQPDFDESSPAWLKRLMAMPATKTSMSLGMFNLSIEGIIRVCLDQDASKPVELSAEMLAPCLKHLSEDDIDPDVKSWALAVLAAALASQEGTFKLKLSQQRRGPPAMQASDQAEAMTRSFYIARSAKDAAARGERSPSKVAAREHGASADEVKDAKALVMRLQRLADQQE